MFEGSAAAPLELPTHQGRFFVHQGARDEWPDNHSAIASVVSVTKEYRPWTPEQAFLLPPSPMDRLPEGHLAYLILELVRELDVSAIEDGHPKQRSPQVAEQSTHAAR